MGLMQLNKTVYYKTHNDRGVLVKPITTYSESINRANWYVADANALCDVLSTFCIETDGKMMAWYDEETNRFLEPSRILCPCMQSNYPATLDIVVDAFYMLRARYGVGVYPPQEERYYAPQDDLHTEVWRKDRNDPEYKGSNNTCEGPGIIVYAISPVQANGCFQALRVKRAEDFPDVINRDINELELTLTRVSIKKADVQCKIAVRNEWVPYLDDWGMPQFYCYNIKKGDVPSVCTNHIYLRTMEIFSNCGGLGIGLETTDIFKVIWSADKSGMEKNACKNMHSNATFYECDLALIARNVATTGLAPRGWPEPKLVDCIVGSPLCKGYSRIKQNHSQEREIMRNPDVFAFLQMVQFYTPKVVILNQNTRLKQRNLNADSSSFILEAFLEMGYSVSLSVLQAGAFGCPQDRDIPCYIAVDSSIPEVPILPPALFDFPRPSKQCDRAPYFRTITVKEAIGDLTYPGFSTWFTRLLQSDEPIKDTELTTRMFQLQAARLSQIPAKAGADWRDLPNLGGWVKGLFFTPLPYNESGRICNCHFIVDKHCDFLKRYGARAQRTNKGMRTGFLTLIPAYLPHLADVMRFSEYEGSFGYLNWEGHFDEMVEAPALSSSNGRFIHPNKPRVYTVREAARAQTLPDCVSVKGSNVNEVYKCIGASTPPFVALCIGFCIKRALLQNCDKIP
ncbi:hypothetical protein [Ranid herpesvirus 3]|uniref:DNA (cytosine-5-)-methyltransferase n=1 Tax=Ranid herpesvirus 3 TaxID=1987509 RepID=A0A1X9T5D9_9VIRU|nr:hypothetical protein [Ranid herpesvirus 3]ARR28865.1 hypothetical protein [Ranid herpesvirus 3]